MPSNMCNFNYRCIIRIIPATSFREIIQNVFSTSWKLYYLILPEEVVLIKLNKTKQRNSYIIRYCSKG